MAEQKQVLKNEKGAIAQYVKFNELLLNGSKADLDKLQRIPAKLKRTFGKKSGQEIVSISLNIEDDHFRELKLNDGGQYLNAQRFNLIKLELNLPLKDPKGRPLSQWDLNVPVRFVHGVTKTDNEFHIVQVAFGRELFINSFLQDEDVKLIKKLESMKKVDIKWVESPEKLDDVERLPEVIFN